MPAKFHPLSPAIWDRAMRDLSADGKLVRLYLLTCANRLSEGLFQIPLGIIAHDTGLPVESVGLALDELDACGLARYDAHAEVVLDCTALRYMPLRNGRDAQGNAKPDKRIPGAVRMLESVPDTSLKGELFRLAEELSPDLATAIAERFPDLPIPNRAPRLREGSSPVPGRVAEREAQPVRSFAELSAKLDGSGRTTRPSEGPSALTGAPSDFAEAPRREEQIRDEPRREEPEASAAMQARHEQPDSVSENLCGFCDEPAMKDGAGRPHHLEGLPFCGWCRVVPV